MSWLYTLAGLLFVIVGLLSGLDGHHEWAIVFATIGVIFTGMSGEAAKGDA